MTANRCRRRRRQTTAKRRRVKVGEILFFGLTSVLRPRKSFSNWPQIQEAPSFYTKFFFCHIFPPDFELRPFLQHFCCHWPQNSFIVCKNAPFVGRISRLLSLSPRNKQASLKPKYRQARRRPSPSFLLIDFLFRFEKKSHASTLKMLIGQKNANTVVSQGTTILKSCIIRVEKIISRQITYLSNSATASGGPLTPIAVLKRLRRPRGRALS